MINLALPAGEKPLIFYLALEEYVARCFEDDILFLWSVAPTVICGRNQVIAAETDLAFCKRHGINVFRRKSGGGAVYSDWGNIMVSYIVTSGDVPFTFDKYLRSVALYLRSIGLPAERSGRNDILVEGRKVSGNAFFKSGHRSIVHGTMLFNTDFDMMAAALTPSYGKISSKGIASVRQRVANISDFTDLSKEEFMTSLVDFFCNDRMELPEGVDGEIDRIMTTYTDEDFLHGHEPQHEITFRGEPEGVGELVAYCEVKGGKLRGIELKGDFFPLCEAPGKVLTEALSGVEFEKEAVEAALSPELPGRIVRNLTKGQLLELLF